MYPFNILHDETFKLRDFFILECLCFLLNPFGKLNVHYSGLINMMIMISITQLMTNQPLTHNNNNHIIYGLRMIKKKKIPIKYLE